MSLKTRRRGAELEDAILEAAWEVLTEHGYAGFTYEAVAARAGTSRPVLYRRWPQREDLLLATLGRGWLDQPIELPDTGSLRGDAVELLRRINAGRARMMMTLTVQLMDYFRDTGTNFRELRDTLRGQGRPIGFEILIDRAVERGELADVPRPPRVVSLPMDLLRHEMLMTLRPVPDEVIAEIVDDVWLPRL
ncbi:TetR/AcrR family transcriptional regulator [Actinoplanes sp. CA-054009]